MAEYMNRWYGIDVRITKIRVKAAGGSTSRRNTGPSLRAFNEVYNLWWKPSGRYKSGL